jgi:hypothetical protein
MDSVQLQAPRPMRLLAPFAFHRPTRMASPFRQDNDSVAFRSPSSPLLHSRSPSATLSSEALEEFFSILKPSFLPSTSPSLGKSRRSLTIPSFQQYERPLALRPRQRLEIRVDPDEPSDSHLATSTSSDAVGGEHQDMANDFFEQDTPSSRWFRFGPLCRSIVLSWVSLAYPPQLRLYRDSTLAIPSSNNLARHLLSPYEHYPQRRSLCPLPLQTSGECCKTPNQILTGHNRLYHIKKHPPTLISYVLSSNCVSQRTCSLFSKVLFTLCHQLPSCSLQTWCLIYFEPLLCHWPIYGNCIIYPYTTFKSYLL